MLVLSFARAIHMSRNCLKVSFFPGSDDKSISHSQRVAHYGAECLSRPMLVAAPVGCFRVTSFGHRLDWNPANAGAAIGSTLPSVP
jgi:hypothetical protein